MKEFLTSQEEDAEAATLHEKKAGKTPAKKVQHRLFLWSSSPSHQTGAAFCRPRTLASFFFGLPSILNTN